MRKLNLSANPLVMVLDRIHSSDLLHFIAAFLGFICPKCIWHNGYPDSRNTSADPRRGAGLARHPRHGAESCPADIRRIGCFAWTIAENIALCDYENIDHQKLEYALRLSGLKETVDRLAEGYRTQMLRVLDENGIELSGGQAGRVAIARAVYKDAPFVVLDEPTAALDPIAEYEIYKNFNDLVRGKTTIYISHRLSSCRFCDAVAVFENGRITEYGSHDKLLENRDGLYSEMWHAQSRYYV